MARKGSGKLNHIETAAGRRWLHIVPGGVQRKRSVGGNWPGPLGVAKVPDAGVPLDDIVLFVDASKEAPGVNGLRLNRY